MRLAILYLDALGEGGYPRDIRHLAQTLADRGVSVSLVTRSESQGNVLDGVTLVPAGNARDLLPDLDILHMWGVFMPRQFWIGRRAFRNVSVVISPMGHLISAHIRRHWWKKVPYLAVLGPLLAALRPAAHLFSDAELDGVRRFLRPRAHFFGSLGVFPVPVDASRAPSTAHDYLLFFGRNDVYQKGIDLLLTGYAAAVQQGLELPLRIAGQPHAGSRRVIARLVENLGISSRVELAGKISEQEKWELLRNARCLVFPSRWDGPPRPIREAISAGTPVIVTPGTNLGDFVTQFHAGLTVPFRRDDMARGLLSAADDATVHRWMRGASLLRHELSWENVAEHYLAGYESILDLGRA